MLPTRLPDAPIRPIRELPPSQWAALLRPAPVAGAGPARTLDFDPFQSEDNTVISVLGRVEIVSTDAEATIGQPPQRMERGLQEQDRLTTTDARTVADALEQAAAPNTRRAYAGAWAAFTTWASASGYPVLPASQETLSAYLGQLAGQGRKLATVRLHRAAVMKAHRLAGHSSTGGELVGAVLKGLGRQFGGPQKQAQPLTHTVLAAIRATAPIPRRTRGGNLETAAAAARRGATDVAIITTMRDGLLRVSEAAALTWGDIQPQPDGSGLMRIRRSKTDALGDGVLLYLGEEAMEALAAIRPESAAPDGPVFDLKPAGIAARDSGGGGSGWPGRRIHRPCGPGGDGR